MTVAEVICLRERLQKEVDSLKYEDIKMATDLIRLLKAGRKIISPAPERY